MVIIELTNLYTLFAQNILNTNSWNPKESVAIGYSPNGAASENARINGKNHVGEEVILWEAKPDEISGADGGWNTDWHNIDHNTTYRFSVWLKKTNSNHGSSYLGFYANNTGSLTLTNTYNGNPYFWYGDLPKLNRWYLVVGYVHKSSHTGTTHIGGIYDGATGEKVRSITDFKLKNTVTSVKHRSYLYYDTNTLDRQYFYEPRIDPINGKEPSIDALLKINEHAKLIVTYDTASNQTQTFYCDDPATCSPDRARTARKRKQQSVTTKTTNELSDDFLDAIRIYPNPTSGIVTFEFEEKLIENSLSVKLYNTASILIKDFGLKKELQFDFSEMASGVYFLHIHTNKGTSITKKIIKK